MMSNRVPLSKLFKRLDDPYGSIDDALKAIGGDFEVEKRDVFILDDQECITDEIHETQVDGYSAVVRRDTGVPLSVMGNRYGVVQYRSALSFLSEVIGNKQAEIYAGQVVEGGAKLHLIVKTPDFVELTPGERFDCFFTVSASHDGTGCLQAMCSPVHNISQTVFTPAGGGVVRIKHSAKVDARLAQAQRMFNKLHTHFVEFGEQVKDMCGITLTEQEAGDYFYSIVDGESTRAQNIREKMYDIFTTTGLCVRLPSCKGTLFGAFMAVQQYADYYKTVRKSIRRNELDAKIEARLSGDGAKLKAESFAMALAILRTFS